MEIFIQLLLNGLLLGGTLAIISIGLTLIFGIVRVVNFAHGEFLMIGMYTGLLTAQAMGMDPLLPDGISLRDKLIDIERSYIELQERVLQNISVNAEERYRAFVQQNPGLVQRLPGTQIASYLGITAEFLSKVKKKLAERR